MQDLAKSWGSLTWALSLLGLQTITHALTSTGDNEKAVAALNDVSKVSIDRAGTAVREVFDAGDVIQRRMIDVLLRAVMPASNDQDIEACSCRNAAAGTRRRVRSGT